MSGELAAIARLRRLLAPAPPGQTWIGDDAAVVAPPEGGLLLTTDAMVAGVHADLALVGLEDMGWKALSAAVSDIAAMGGTPRYALVAVSGPASTDIERLYRGLGAASRAYACPVVGGDLSAGTELVVSVSVTGDTGGLAPVLRSGARPGDTLFVTGRLGSSAAGLRLLRAGEGDDGHPLVRAHRRPRARPGEGRAARAGGATAMIDLSDGLATDVRHLAEASGVGVVLDTVPRAEGASVEEALGGGEDYELAFSAADPAGVSSSFAASGLRPPLPIGTCSADPDERLLAGEPLPVAGWEHEWS